MDDSKGKVQQGDSTFENIFDQDTEETVDLGDVRPKRAKIAHAFEVFEPMFDRWEVKDKYELLMESGKGSYGAVAKARER